MNLHFLYQEIQFEKSKMNLNFWTKLMNRHFHLELKPTIGLLFIICLEQRTLKYHAPTSMEL